jgi:hypothetical protein
MPCKSLVLAGALAIFTTTMVCAKSYDIWLNHSAQAGKTQLMAGHYSVKLVGSEAIFTDVDHEKSYTAPVKVETEDKKFPVTTVETGTEGNTDQIKSIELGGSTTKLEFGE